MLELLFRDPIAIARQNFRHKSCFPGPVPNGLLICGAIASNEASAGAIPENISLIDQGPIQGQVDLGGGGDDFHFHQDQVQRGNFDWKRYSMDAKFTGTSNVLVWVGGGEGGRTSCSLNELTSSVTETFKTDGYKKCRTRRHYTTPADLRDLFL